MVKITQYVDVKNPHTKGHTGGVIVRGLSEGYYKFSLELVIQYCG